MLLRNITLEDFGAYRGKQSLDLTTRPGKPIVLIGGLNGCGKTTLLDALQLVLYGPRARCSGRGNRPYEAYLRDCINRKADPSRGAALTLEFSITVEGKERIYKLTRNWVANGKTLHEYVNVKVDGVWDRVISEGWANHVEDLLPLEIGSLFFFDGEKIESLADPERASAVIQSAVHSLLGVNTVQQLRTDLLALQRRQKLADEEQEAIDQIRELEERHEAVQAEVERAQVQAASLRSALGTAKKNMVRADDAFARDGGELFERRKELEARRKDAAKHLTATQEALLSIAAGVLPLRLLTDQLVAVHKQAAVEQEGNEAAQILSVLVARDQELLARLETLLPKDDLGAFREHLDSDRQQREHSSKAERVLNLTPDGQTQLAGLDQVLTHEQKRADELLALAADQAATVEALDRQLAGVPDEKLIASRLEDRESARQALHRAEALLAGAVEAHSAAKSRRDALKTQLERAHDARVKSLVRAEEIERIVAYCDRQREVMDRFGDALLKRHINRLEVAVLESFSRLMRKRGLVRDLNIDTDRFRLTLVDSEGEPLDPGRLSAGERQLLAVSLLWGLARVAGNWLPSVIDTPLGRLDSRHREHLVDRYFPHASHQVLLLSTDEEIDEHLLKRLKPSIAHTYTLVHDDTTFTTSVEPGYWWTSGATHVA
ncbi:DNA sulfur modification protein DndD [Streptomyces kaniharaensis]|uniref:Nuclease SbcCD subunit C n=1 Tax=Streptomyces kaniharaensis TaxID=212423 RepID=A0A6N7KTH5_9ACTN|nr:DNA sulfur modification protein DndD [Streptomyces kaniharaensis]MQS14741.1 DNA sulfur modification protein DndD [Streptomyces kaniharaensis]